MNSENIKAIIELFSNLGASSKEAFLWYLGVDFLKHIMPWGVAALAAYLAYRLIAIGLSNDRSEEAMKKLRKHANLGDSFYITEREILLTLDHYMKGQAPSFKDDEIKRLRNLLDKIAELGGPFSSGNHELELARAKEIARMAIPPQ